VRVLRTGRVCEPLNRVAEPPLERDPRPDELVQCNRVRQRGELEMVHGYG